MTTMRWRCNDCVSEGKFYATTSPLCSELNRFEDSVMAPRACREHFLTCFRALHRFRSRETSTLLGTHHSDYVAAAFLPYVTWMRLIIQAILPVIVVEYTQGVLHLIQEGDAFRSLLASSEARGCANHFESIREATKHGVSCLLNSFDPSVLPSCPWMFFSIHIRPCINIPDNIPTTWWQY